MPIGKNAIKRVNDGYSNVKSEAPDMENSIVVEAKKPAAKKSAPKNPAPKAATSKTKTSASRGNPVPKAVVQIAPRPAAKKTVKKTVDLSEGAENIIAEHSLEIAEVKEEKSEAVIKKSMETEPELRPVKTLEKITEKSERSGDGYTNLGGSLPYYLL